MAEISQILLLKALDGLSARAAAIAQNIANASTEGYRPLRVSFEEALSSAAAQGPSAVANVEPQLEESAPGEPLRLDLEIAHASGTAGRYGALIELLGRQIQLETLAIMGTR